MGRPCASTARGAQVKYILEKQPDGTWRASLHLPAGDGSFAAVANGISKAEATQKAAGVAKAAGHGPNKSQAVLQLAKAAAIPEIKNLLKEQGLAAATAAAQMIPGGAAVVTALRLAAKYGPVKRLLSKLIS